jgi:hypothetical protein
MTALQQRVRTQHRLVYYVLPEATCTADIHHSQWLVESTWFLDVANIPTLSAPTRKSNLHHVTLQPGTGHVTITSEPVHTQARTWRDLTENVQVLLPGSRYEDFEIFWKYAQLLGRHSAAMALPR